MNVPPAETIASVSSLASSAKPKSFMNRPWSESTAPSIGDEQAKILGVSFPVSDDFLRGYQLGLETARGMISASVELITHGADPKKVL